MNTRTLSKIGHHIYVKNGIEAIPFYQEAFCLELNEEPWIDEEGFLIHAELQFAKEHYLSISDIKHQDNKLKKRNDLPSSPSMMFTVYFYDEDAITTAYRILSQEAISSTGLRSDDHSKVACDMIDKYRVCWHLSVPLDKKATFIPK